MFLCVNACSRVILLSRMLLCVYPCMHVCAYDVILFGVDVIMILCSYACKRVCFYAFRHS